MSDITPSKRKAFRHALRFVQISELQKDETATTRVFRTPTSLWEYQTSFITRVRQHALGLCSDGLRPPTRKQTPCDTDPSSTLSEIFDELVSATPLAAFRRTYVRLKE